jgi:hypothetical protein
MFLSPHEARALLPYVDPARMRGEFPVGLRDGALLCLISVDVLAEELPGLRAPAFTMEHGRLRVTLERVGVEWIVILPRDHEARLLAWLTARRLWSTEEHVITGPKGPLSQSAIYKLLRRYARKARRSRSTR